MSDEVSIPKSAGFIPHFWFDAIGRMIPGALTLMGLYWLGRPDSGNCGLQSCLQQFHLPGVTPGPLFLWAIASYLVGFPLGGLSHLLVARVWEWISPWNEPSQLAAIRGLVPWLAQLPANKPV